MDAPGRDGSRDEIDGALEAARRGDTQALNWLLEQHLPALRAFVHSKASRKLLARETISDLVQSACREVLKDLPHETLTSEEDFRRWLFLAVERKIIDHARFHDRAKRTAPGAPHSSGDPPALVAEDIATRSTPSQEAMAHEVRERIEIAMQELPPDQREVIRLSRLLGLSHSEIAERLERSPAAVRELLHRALARLDRMLEERED